MKNNYSKIFTKNNNMKNKRQSFAMTIFISIKKTLIVMKKNIREIFHEKNNVF